MKKEKQNFSTFAILYLSVIYKICTFGDRVSLHRHDPDGLWITCPRDPTDPKLEICSLFCFGCLLSGQGRINSHHHRALCRQITLGVSKGSRANWSPAWINLAIVLFHLWFFVFVCFVGFFCVWGGGGWPCPRHAEVPGPGIKPTPQQWLEPQQWQCQIPNPLNHQGTPCFKFVLIIMLIENLFVVYFYNISWFS